MKSRDYAQKINELRTFIENTTLPDFPVSFPRYGVIINPRKFLKNKMEQIDKNPNSHHYRRVIDSLHAIKNYIIGFC